MDRKKNIYTKQGYQPFTLRGGKMEYIIKQIVDDKEEPIYTKAYDEIEREFFDLFLEEKGIDEEDYEDEGGDVDKLWDEFFESETYKEFHEHINEDPDTKTDTRGEK